jgi:predicted GNAT family acetyltransferase
MVDHILDRPIWSALTTVHAGLARGTERAKRFAEDISPLASTPDDTVSSLAELANLIPAGDRIVMAQADPIPPLPGMHPILTAVAVQMLFDGPSPAAEGRHFVERLTAADGPEMFALATLTKPGPYAARAFLLGEYWGVKRDGKLIAMAGERLKQPGFTEVSGVCTHPDHQGQGLARELCLTLLTRIVGRGEQPYLHVFATNAMAINLYEKLGFHIRMTMNVAQLEKL